jgi:hypothetical protein
MKDDTLTMANSSALLAPAQDAIEYHTVVFSSSFGKKKTKYQGPPTDEVDDSWSDLYDGNGPRPK